MHQFATHQRKALKRGVMQRIPPPPVTPVDGGDVAEEQMSRGAYASHWCLIILDVADEHTHVIGAS